MKNDTEIKNVSIPVAENHTISDEPDKKEKFFYGFGTAGFAIMNPLLGSYLLFYYTDVIGIGASFVGTLLLFARFLDGATDIGVGVLVDKTTSKHGKSRPWILWASLPMSILFVLIFTVPDLGETGMKVYATTIYVLFICFITAIMVPYKTLLGLMTQDPFHRAETNVFSGLFSIIGNVGVMILTVPIVNALGGGKSGWILVVIMLAIITYSTLMISYKKVHERVEEKKSSYRIPFKVAIKQLVKNKYWIIATSYILIVHVLTALITGSGLYFVIVYFGSNVYFSLFAGSALLSSVLAIFFLSPLFKRFGKRNVALFVTVFAAFGPLLKLIDPSDVLIVFIGSFIQGFSLIPVFTVMDAMTNDTVEYGEWKSGVRTAGLINSAVSFGHKAGLGIGGALIGWSLAASGYVGGQTEQTAAATKMILYLNVHIPFIIIVISAILLYLYKLDAIFPTILKELKERKQND